MPITIPMKKPVQQIEAPLGLKPTIITDDFYAGLDASVAGDAKAAANRIHARIGSMKVSVIEIGKDLVAIKVKLGHGAFGSWLDLEFGMSERTARRYMLAAKTLGAMSANLADLPKHIIDALAAPSIPDEVKEVVIAEVEAGDAPKVADVKTMIAKAKALEAAVPDMPPAQKVAAVAAAVAAPTTSKSPASKGDKEVREKAAIDAVQLVAKRLGIAFPAFVELYTVAGSKAFDAALKEAAGHAG